MNGSTYSAFYYRYRPATARRLTRPPLRASPRLKDADLSPDEVPALYIEIVCILRAIFFRCRLVHADFSEYNIL